MAEPTKTEKNNDEDLENEIVNRKGDELRRLWDLGPLVNFPLSYIFAYCIILPVLGFIGAFSVAVTMKIQFGSKNKTHLGLRGSCDIHHGNEDEIYLPSVAKAVEIDAIANVIWRFGITLISIPRICVAICYRNLYLETGPARISDSIVVRSILIIQTLLHAAENVCLSLLVIVPAKDSLNVHFYTFWIFGISSIVFMLSNSIMFFLSGGIKNQPEGSVSFWIKIVAFAVYATSFIAFARTHSQLWEDITCHYHAYIDIYTGIAEYLSVVAYTLYHSTAYWDIFKDSDFVCEPTLPPPPQKSPPEEEPSTPL